MPAPSLFSIVLIGLLAGLAARWLLGRRQSLFASLLTGLAGAALGSVVAGLLRLPIDGLLPMTAAALAGSTLLLSIVSLVHRR